MREIKFRAWDRKANAWVLNLTEVIDPTMAKGYSTRLRHDRHIILMQYTGLTDKNGKEICEGDIVKAKLMRGDNHSYTHVVEFVTRPAPMFAINDRQMNDDEFEVIGNIYENADLLSV